MSHRNVIQTKRDLARFHDNSLELEISRGVSNLFLLDLEKLNHLSQLPVINFQWRGFGSGVLLTFLAIVFTILNKKGKQNN